MFWKCPGCLVALMESSGGADGELGVQQKGSLMATTHPRSTRTTPAASVPLAAILDEISVPLKVIEEARRRRNLVLAIACEHAAARARFSTGSVAYGVANSPLEDADGGIKINRRLDDARQFGPDGPAGLGPTQLMEFFGDFVVERLRGGGYPDATVDTSGKRSVKFSFHMPVDVDELGLVDPYVDFIIGLERVGARGIWIPNRSIPAGWDVADPAAHLQAMNRSGDPELRVLRAHAIRLAKRAIKRDKTIGRTPVVCPWNVCALAIESVGDATVALPVVLAELFEWMAVRITQGPTPDPSPVVEPIALPEGVTTVAASTRLGELAYWARAASEAMSEAEARRAYAQLYGPELDAIRKREASERNKRLSVGLPAVAVAASASHRAVRSDGD